MASAKTPGKVKVTFDVSGSLRKNFNRHCKKINVTAAQWFRDAMKKELSAAKA